MTGETIRPTFPWHKRVQFEIGGRWQMVPDRETSFRQWAFDPFAGFTWPGKPATRADLPDGEVYGGLEADPSDPKLSRSLVWWARCGVRILGLDIGVGVFIRSQKSVDKLTRGLAR